MTDSEWPKMTDEAERLIKPLLEYAERSETHAGLVAGRALLLAMQLCDKGGLPFLTFAHDVAALKDFMAQLNKGEETDV